MFRNISREVLLFLACAVFTGTVGLILVDTVIMPYFTRKAIEVEVPDIVDMTPTQARRKLSRFGLRLKLQDPRWDNSIQEGHLVFQNPLAFSRVKPNRTVYAVPSKGNRRYEVPNLQGKSLRQARLWVDQSELEIGEIVEEASARVKEGFVISHFPSPGSNVDAGTVFSMTVSTGPKRALVAVPNMIGMRLATAQRRLRSLGLNGDDVRYEFSTAYETDIVIRQTPLAGEVAKRGSRVQLVVSKL